MSGGPSLAERLYTAGANAESHDEMAGSLLTRLRSGLAHEVKVRLAGTDLMSLVEHRDRRRLRWLATDAADESLRLRALRHLSEMADAELLPFFSRYVEAPAGGEPTLAVRFAAQALGRLQHGGSTTALRRLLATDRPVAVQITAARALAGLGGAEAWSAIKEACLTAGRSGGWLPDGRDCVVDAGEEQAGTAEAAWVFQTHFPDQEPRWWRTKAAAWLRSTEPVPRVPANHGADRAVAALLRQRIDKHEGDAEEQRHQLVQLATLGQARDHERFAQHLLNATPERRPSLWAALGLVADPEAWALLSGEVQIAARDPGLALDLLRALARTSDPRAVATVLDLASRVRAPALAAELAFALGELGGEQAVRALVDAARTGQDAAGNALDERGLDHVGRALRRTGRMGREAARGALAIARAGGGERDRLDLLVERAGLR